MNLRYVLLLFSPGKRRFNIKLWKTFTDCFNCLPVAAIVDEKIFCCHGGLSPDLQSMEQIRRIMRPTDVPDTGQYPRQAPYRRSRYRSAHASGAAPPCLMRVSTRFKRPTGVANTNQYPRHVPYRRAFTAVLRT